MIKIKGGDVEKAKVHLLPFEFKTYSGEAKISQYFVVRESEEKCENLDDFSLSFQKEKTSPQLLETSFRGRSLKGARLQLLPRFSGAVFEEQSSLLNNSSQRTWELKKTFSELHVWNLEIPPSKDDKAIRWIYQFPHISQMIHQPISGADSKLMSEQLEKYHISQPPKRKPAEEPQTLKKLKTEESSSSSSLESKFDIEDLEKNEEKNEEKIKEKEEEEKIKEKEEEEKIKEKEEEKKIEEKEDKEEEKKGGKKKSQSKKGIRKRKSFGYLEK